MRVSSTNQTSDWHGCWQSVLSVVVGLIIASLPGPASAFNFYYNIDFDDDPEVQSSTIELQRGESSHFDVWMNIKPEVTTGDTIGLRAYKTRVQISDAPDGGVGLLPVSIAGCPVVEVTI